MAAVRFDFEGIQPESKAHADAAQGRTTFTFEPERSAYQEWMDAEMVRRRQYTAQPEAGLLSAMLKRLVDVESRPSVEI